MDFIVDGRWADGMAAEIHNCERPHSSLGDRTPEKFRKALSCGDMESQ